MEKNNEMNEIIATIDELIKNFGDKKAIQTKDIMRFYSLLESGMDENLDEIEDILINRMKENSENEAMIKQLLEKLNKLRGE